MNVVSARNCVSASHFAAATCHYCTITVCTTIVASRTSFVQSDPIILANLVFEFREADISPILHRTKNRVNVIYDVKIKNNRMFSSHEESIVFSPSFDAANFSRWNRESCALRQHYTLNPIILADYWLDSVCSLCRWSRLTLSLPCLVRLHIYIINYITLLIIIFTPSRVLLTHTQPHDPKTQTRNTRDTHIRIHMIHARLR